MEKTFDEIGVSWGDVTYGMFWGRVSFNWEADEGWYVEMIRLKANERNGDDIGLTRLSSGFGGLLFKELSHSLLKAFAADLEDATVEFVLKRELGYGHLQKELI